MDFELTLDFYLHIHFQFGDGGNGIEPNTSPNQTNSFVFLLFNSIYIETLQGQAQGKDQRETLYVITPLYSQAPHSFVLLVFCNASFNTPKQKLSRNARTDWFFNLLGNLEMKFALNLIRMW